MEELSRALALLETLPDSTERQQREIGLRMGLVGPQTAARGYEDSELMANLGRADVLCDGLGTGTQQLAGLLPLAVYHTTRGDLPKASRYAARVLEIAEPLGIAELQVAGHMIVGSAAITASPIAEAVAHLERAIELAEVAVLPPPTATFDVDVLTIAHSAYAIALVLDGQWSRARQHQAMSVARGEDTNHLNSLGSCLLSVGIGSYFLDDPVDTAMRVRQLVEAVEDRGFHSFDSSGRVFDGWARVMQGDAGGIETMAAGVALAEDSGARAGIVQLYFTAADTCIVAADFERAAGYLDLAKATIEVTQERTAFEPQIPMFQAGILLGSGTGSDQEINDLLDDSTRRWKAFGSEWMEIRTAVLRGELAARTGNTEAAREHLGRLCARFDDAPAIGRIAAARKLLAELS
jgi:hypothetical protein